MQCPRCDGSTKKRRPGDVIIDLCDGCHGFWLDKGELDEVVAAASRRGSPSEVTKQLGGLLVAGRPLTRESALSCPRCHVPMNKVAFAATKAEVIGDVCPSCQGVWLDRGELGSIFVTVENALT